MSFPQAVGTAKGGKAAFGGNARAGQNHDAVDVLLHVATLSTRDDGGNGREGADGQGGTGQLRPPGNGVGKIRPTSAIRREFRLSYTSSPRLSRHGH